MLSRRVIAYYGLMRASESLPAAYGFAAGAAAPKENGLRWESRGSPIYSAGLYSRAASHTPATRRVRLTASSSSVLPRQERSSQARNHGTTPPYGRELPPGRTRKGEVDSDSLFRVFRWIPWLISDPSGAAIGCCWTESAVRICADLGCRGNNRQPLSQVVLPFGPELFHHKPIHVAEADLLEVSQATVGREQVFAVGVGVAEDVADLAADRGNPALEILAVADQGPVLPLPRRGLVGLGDHVQDQEFGQNLGIQAVGLLGALGNHPELLGIGQHDLLGQGLHELDEPDVAGGGLDDHFEGAELPEEIENLVGLSACECFPSQDLSLLVHDANGNRLLVKVNADEVHCRSPGLGKRGIGKNSSSLPQVQRFRKPSRRPLPPSHSFKVERFLRYLAHSKESGIHLGERGSCRASSFSLDFGRLGGSLALPGNMKQPWRPPARQVDAVTLSRVEEHLALAQVFDLDQSSLGEPAGIGTGQR